MVQVLCPVVVGRDAELEAIDAALATAMAGHGGCLVITGEPGIGKSRLARELSGRATGRGIRVVAGRAVQRSATAADLERAAARNIQPVPAGRRRLARDAWRGEAQRSVIEAAA